MTRLLKNRSKISSIISKNDRNNKTFSVTGNKVLLNICLKSFTIKAYSKITGMSILGVNYEYNQNRPNYKGSQ